MYSVHITVNKEFTGHEGFNGSRVKAEEKRRRVGKGKPEGENQSSLQGILYYKRELSQQKGRTCRRPEGER